MAKAIVLDAHKTKRIEGVVVRVCDTGGIILDLDNGTRYYATSDRVVSINGETYEKEKWIKNGTE